MRKLICLFFGITLLCSCKKNDDEFSLYHEDGRAKPIVVINPVINSTSYDVPWSLSEEFTDLMTPTSVAKPSPQSRQQINWRHNSPGVSHWPDG